MCVSNVKHYLPKHYLDVGLLAEWESGEPTVMEANKIESWDWYDVSELPGPLMAGMNHYIEAYQGGENLFHQ